MPGRCDPKLPKRRALSSPHQEVGGGGGERGGLALTSLLQAGNYGGLSLEERLPGVGRSQLLLLMSFSARFHQCLPPSSPPEGSRAPIKVVIG